MAEIIHEFSLSMQKFLLKSAQEYGLLRWLSSRATIQTSTEIDELVHGVCEIFNTYKILPMNRYTKSYPYIEQKSEFLIYQSYRYLVMNTYFHVQSFLAEDTLHGYMVDTWPAFSPYLFIQIIWKLKCDDLLIESVLHAPIELSIEIMEIASKYVTELEFERALCFMINLISHTYKRCFMWKTVGAQISPKNDFMSCAEQLELGFQTSLDQITNLHRINAIDFSEELIYERHGIILKNIIRMIKICIEIKLKNDDIRVNWQEMYSFTFDYDENSMLPNESFKEIIATFDKELVVLLLDQMKKVDCVMYISWAEVHDRDNTHLTLQRAIAIECYYFIQFIKNLYVKPFRKNELLGCLQQLAGSDCNETILTLSELCDSIVNGRSESIKELIKRYREWDLSTLHFIQKWWSLLDKDDCLILFDYLKYVFFQNSYTETEKYECYLTVVRILMNRHLSDIYSITMSYILRYSDNNFLESFYNQNNFDLFIRNNINARDPIILRTLLSFLLLNPKSVLVTLVEIAIGCNLYSNILFTSEDLLFFRPFLCMQWNADNTYLAYILKEICTLHVQWDTKKFTNFVRVMLDRQIISSDDVMNNVFIPYLAEELFDQYNINCVLINIRKIMDSCTHKMNVVGLCEAIARKMSVWRKCDLMLPRYIVNEVLENMMRILDSYQYQSNRMSVLEKREVMDAVKVYLQPLDRAHLAQFSCMLRGNILNVISDYEKRCCALRRKLERLCILSDIKNYVAVLKLEREDFIRHMFLHATKTEYLKYSLELAVMFWCFFGWSNEIEAYDNVLRIAMTAGRIVLEYPNEFPRDSFIDLLGNVLCFCRKLASFERCKEEMIMQILLKNLSTIDNSIRRTQYSSLYDSLHDRLDKIEKDVNLDLDYFQVLCLIEEFINEATKLIMMPSNSNDFNEAPSEDIYDYYKVFKFISICLSVPDIKRHHRCINKIEQIICTDDTNVVSV